VKLDYILRRNTHVSPDYHLVVELHAFK